MAHRTRDLTRDWRKGDAERLARFMNETGRAWPGGNWDPRTPEEAERGVREQASLGVFVAEVGDAFVAFCSLAARPGERHRAYVPFLTGHPDYQGKGFGKAVLLRAVERTYDLGIPRIDLHTWPGNLKAVPLYKKSGFMWSPESGPGGVYMQNFTPGARQHPFAQEFFRRHDWYQTLERDLSLTADDHKRGKVRAYPYQWEADGDRLRLVFDRQSWGLLEIETNDLLVGCFLEDEKLVAGLPHRIRWQIVNYGRQPLEVVLMASADEGIALDHRQALRVDKRAELEAEFEIDPEIAEKEKEPRVPIIHSDLLINGVPLRLSAGFQIKQAVTFSLDGDGQGLQPGRPERVVVQGWSELDRPADVSVRIGGAAGVTVELAHAKLRLPARGSAELPVTLTAAEAGAAPLRVESQVNSDGKVVKPKAAVLNARFLRPGDLVGHIEDDAVVLESAALRVALGRRGGWGAVTDKVRNRRDVVHLPQPHLGPPFAWDEFFETRCEARLERDGDRLEAILRTPSVYRPGVWLERHVALTNLPLIEVKDVLINGSAKPLRGRVETSFGFRTGGGSTVVPTRQGVVRSRHGTAGRTVREHDLPDKGADWPEGWVASEDDQGLTAGLIWDRAERVGSGWSGHRLERAFPEAAPGESTTPGPLYLFVGEGDFFTVRRWWQTLFGPRVDREQRRPEARPPLEFGLRPRPLVIHGRTARAALVADSVGRLKLRGHVEVHLPDGLRADPRRAEFARACEGHRCARRISVTRRAALPEGAYFAECSARIDRAVYRERQPVIVLGDPRRKVKVEPTGAREELLRIDNGLLALTVAPEFQGSAISLARQGAELLRSAYPEARPLAYMNPWFGGIQPSLGGVGREIFEERFRAREIERRGNQGVTWRGVRVSCSPKHERGRFMRLEVDYLLAPGSDIFAVAVRTTRRADTAGGVHAGFDLWPVLGGSHLDAVLRGQSDERTSRLRCDFGGGVRGDRWVIAENPKTGPAVLISCRGGEAGTHGQVLGVDGYHLSAGRGAVLAARETRESVFFIAVAEAGQAPALAEALSQLEVLP